MVKKGLFVGLVILISAVLVSAIDTSLTLKTIANANVTVNVINPTENADQSLSEFNVDSGATGEVTHSFDCNFNKVNLNILIRKDGKIYGGQLYQIKDVETGGNLRIEITGGEPIINGAIENEATEPVVEQNLTENASEPEPLVEPEPVQEALTEENKEVVEEGDSVGVTGSAIFGEGSEGFWKVAMWIGIGIGGLVVLLVIVFVVRKVLKTRARKRIESGMPDKKDRLFSKKEESFFTKKEESEDNDSEVEEAEKRLAQVKAEIDKMKNKESDKERKLAELERKFLEAKQELEELRGQR